MGCGVEACGYTVCSSEQRLIDLACWTCAFAHHGCAYVVLTCELRIQVWDLKFLIVSVW